MRLQFDDILAGKTGRPLEMDGDAVIDRDAVGIGETRVGRDARRERATCDRFADLPGPRAGQAHDADPAGTGGCGDRDDGVAGIHRNIIVPARQHVVGRYAGHAVNTSM